MRPTAVYALPFVAVGLLWGASYVVVTTALDSPQDRGQFGDSFGAVNSLFSGLAFAGLIVALLLQRRELSLQREELQLTRDELGRSALAQGKQVEVMHLTARIHAIIAIKESYEREIAETTGAEREALERKKKGLLDNLSLLVQQAREIAGGM